MAGDVSREVGLLRILATSVELRLKPPQPLLNQGYLRSEGLVGVTP
jgi:hypothetical protein